MKINEKIELLKFAIKLNLIIGIYNLFLFSYGNTIFNLVQDAVAGDLDLENVEKRFVRVEEEEDDEL